MLGLNAPLQHFPGLLLETRAQRGVIDVFAQRGRIACVGGLFEMIQRDVRRGVAVTERGHHGHRRNGDGDGLLPVRGLAGVSARKLGCIGIGHRRAGAPREQRKGSNSG